MSRPTQLILTGGTLSASKNAEGLLVPSSSSLNTLADQAGFETDTAVRPYTIDSINFDLPAHYAALRDATAKALDAGKTPVICGGTDSLVWYSTLLTRDLQRQGRLAPGSDERVIFLSSMKSVEEDAAHVARILKAGHKIVTNLPYTGGFAVTAEHTDANSFSIHNVSDGFDKISGDLVHAFRSPVPAAYLIGDTLTFTPSYATPQPEAPKGDGYSRVAAPLLRGSNSEMMLGYLGALASAKQPFDAAIIEGLPGHYARLHRRDMPRLTQLIRTLTAQGTDVVFCSPLRYDAHTHSMQPVPRSEPMGTSPDIEGQLHEAGAQLTTALPKDAWIAATLRPPSQKNPDVAHTLSPRTQNSKTVLGLRYVPDHRIMDATLAALAPYARNIAFSTFPHGAMQDGMADILSRYPGTRFTASFEYDGMTHLSPEGVIEEGATANHYAAGQAPAKHVERLAHARPIQTIHYQR